jgi:hypothetical protein
LPAALNEQTIGPMVEDKSIAERVRMVKMLSDSENGDYHEAVLLALTVVHETAGLGHPLAVNLTKLAANPSSFSDMRAACRTLVTLFGQGALGNKALKIAREIEGDFLAAAEAQVKAAEATTDANARQLRLAVAAFVAGAVLEDGLRRLCDKHGAEYEAGRTSLAKLQTALYQPGKGIEHIDTGENKLITAWGDTRNEADHGHFDKLGLVEVGMMVTGVRDFLSRRLV